MPNNYPQPAVYLQSGAPQLENRAQDSYSAGELGSRFVVIDTTDANRAKGWQLVVMDSVAGAVIAAGAVAYWRYRSGYVVTDDVSVAGRGNVAGVFPRDLTADYVGCIQISGRALVQAQTGPTSAPDDTGKLVIPSATDGKADVLAAGTAATYPPLGVSLGTISAGLFPVELNLPGRP